MREGRGKPPMEIFYGMRAWVPADVLFQELRREAALLNIRSGR
jgi:hypothetical protein